MRAVAISSFRTSPELMDRPKPEVGAAEILVHLRAAGVNPMDWKILDGAYEGQMPHDFPLIAGVDGAGVVEAVGAGVSRFAVGDGVYGQFFRAPVGHGTYAEFVTGTESMPIAPIPRGMWDAQAAAVPTAGMTALHALDELGLTKGQTLLILGAGGGVGSFLVQLASNTDVMALAATRPANRDLLIKLGARRVFDRTLQSFAEDVRIAYPEGVDAVLNLADAGPAFATHLPLVRKGGVAASTLGAATEATVGPLGLRGINLLTPSSPTLLERLSKEFSAGKIRVPLEEKPPLAEFAQALEKSRAGQTRGKTVLLI